MAKSYRNKKVPCNGAKEEKMVKVGVGKPADFTIFEDYKNCKTYCRPELVSRGELMQFTEIYIDGDGIVTDVIDTNIRLTRSECRKKGFGSFDNILQEAKNVQDEIGQNVQQPAGSKTEAGGEAGELENIDNCSGDDNCCGTADNVDDVAKNLENLQEEK